jgi:glycine/D-amino acid oxidase-like deaminating enzyme
MFVYETKDDGVHYAYGSRAHGFTYMPMHGKIVYETLIKKTTPNITQMDDKDLNNVTSQKLK